MEATTSNHCGKTAKHTLGAECVVHVDRSVSASRPDWVRQVLHRDLEGVGPSTFTLSSLTAWELPSVEAEAMHRGDLSGERVFEALTWDKHSLQTSLGLQDLEAIYALDTGAFGRHFGGLMIVAVRSAVLSPHGFLFAPCVHQNDIKIPVFRWCGLSALKWTEKCRVLLYPAS